MNSADLSLYLRRKKSTADTKTLIYQRISKITQILQDKKSDVPIEISDTGKHEVVTANQFINLLNDYLNGDINKFELYFIIHAIETSEDLIVENPDAIKILYQLASPLMKHPLSLNYIKSVIYKP